jgi:CubicO group peptidase (beta-lactamase class C family)
MIWVGMGLATVLAGPHPVEAQVGSAEIDRYVERARQDWSVPGMAVAVVADGMVVHLKGYGVRDLGTGAPVDQETVFEITSATKTFTAAALGMLVAEGALGWDDPVSRHLPQFELNDPYVTERVTFRDLLAHRTGLAYGSSLRDGPYDRNELVRRMRFLPSRHGFREGFAYMHLPYLVAARVLEDKTGMSWDEFVVRRIFQPLGMTRSYTTIAGIEDDPNGGTPHELVDGVMTPVRWINRDNVGPALSINSTAADLARWVAFNLGDGAQEGTRLLPESVLDEIQAPWNIIPLGLRWRDGRPFRAYYPAANLMGASLGWFVSDYRGRTLVEHFGRFAEIAFVPEEGIGVVVLMNTPADLRYALTYWLIDEALGLEGPDWSADMLRETVAARKERETVAAERAESVPSGASSLPVADYAGTYEDPLYGTLRIGRAGEGLGLEFSDIRRGPLEHLGGDAFRITWSEPRFGEGIARFQVEQGRAAAVEVEGLTTFRRRR